jgi:uncharacterized protein (TIGR02597 family)
MNFNHRLIPFAALLVCAVHPAAAQSVVSDPLGFNTIVCPANSDTIVGVPFRPNGSQQGTLSAVPTGTDHVSATLTLGGSPGFTADEFKDTHYVKFTSGAMDGHYYAITGNTADTLTVDLNGENVPGAAVDDNVIIAQFWTLDSLFPPADATTDPATTGHAIVASLGTLAFRRRTSVLLPDMTTTGINLAPNAIFYIHDALWKKAGQGNTDFGATILYPDSYFIIRHPAAVTTGTNFKSSGEVESGNMTIPLSTQINEAQDNFIAIPRPVDVQLNELNLFESGAFVASLGTLAFQRRDQLLVFDNAQQALNKAPSAIYFHDGTNWLKAGDGTNPHDTDVINAGNVDGMFEVLVVDR